MVDRLEFRVLSAASLPEVAGGECNPFVVVKCGSDVEQTPVVSGTTDPSWQGNQRMVFTNLLSAENDVSFVTVKVMHKDMSGGRDEELGSTVISLNTALLGPGIELDDYYDLSSSSESASARPRVRVEMVYFVDGGGDLEEGYSSSDDEGGMGSKKPANAVEGTVHRGRGYVGETKITVRSGEYKHTTRWSKAQTYSSSFRLPAADIFVIKAKSRRVFGDKEIGTCDVALAEIASRGELTKWCRLLGPENTIDDEDRGEVEISFRWIYDKKFAGVERQRKPEMEEPDEEELALLEEEEPPPRDLSYKEREEVEQSREARYMMAERTLEDAPKRMPAGAYQIQVTVVECRDLKPSDPSGTSDPYIRCKILGRTKKTRVIRKVTSAVFNETLNFHFEHLSSQQVDSATIDLKVMDYDYFSSHDLIGALTFDVRAIHDREDHELYREWIEFEGGSLKLSIVVLGPGDEQRPHDVEREYQAEMLEDEKAGGDGVVVKVTELNQNKKKSSSSPNFLVVECWALEDVSVRKKSFFKSVANSARVAVNFAGLQAKTPRDFYTPTEFWLPLNEPIETRLVLVSLLVGSSAADILASVHLDFEQLPSRPRWFSLYGAPSLQQISSKNRQVAYLQNKYGDEASTYRGRILLAARTQQSSWEAKFPHPKRLKRQLVQKPPTATYVLKVLVVSGSELPTLARPGGRRLPMKLVVAIGSYSVETDLQKPEDGVIDWNQMVVLPPLENLPVDVSEMPDVCLYLRTQKNRLVSYSRIPAARLLLKDAYKSPFWEHLRREPATSAYPTDVNPGSVLVQCGLMLEEDALDMMRKDWEVTVTDLAADVAPYCLRVYIYQARDLPPGDSDGLTDAYVKIRFRGKKEKTKVASKTTAPLFYETLQFPNEMLPKDARYGPDIVVQVWDSDTLSPNTPTALLHLPLADCQLLSNESSPAPRPTWRALSDINGDPLSASLLISAGLIRKRDINDKIERPGDITPAMRQAFVEVTLVGVRQLKGFYGATLGAPSSPYVRGDIAAPNDGDAYFRTRPSKASGDDRNARNANFCERKLVPVDLPENALYAQRLDIRVFDNGLTGASLLGACTVDLATKMPWSPNFQSPLTELFDDVEARRRRKLEEEKEEQQQREAAKSAAEDDDDDDYFVFDDADDDKEKVGKAAFGDDDDDEPEVEEGEEREQFELERRPASSRVSADEGIGAFDPKALDDLPPILEDVQFEEERSKREALEADAQLLEDAKSQQPSFFESIQARLNYATDYDAIVSGTTSYKLSELDIDFPTQWVTADYTQGREWWIDPSNDDNQEDGGESLELEHYLQTKPFETYYLYRGKHDPDPSKSTLRQVGYLKAIIRVLEENPDFYESDNFLPKGVLTEAPYVVRLYVISARNLQPVQGKSCDPYLRVKLGASQVDERLRSHQTRTLKPNFYETFEFFTTLPGPSVLKIQVKDWNRFYPIYELVGETKIDIEDRWFHNEWQNLDKPDPFHPTNKLKPIEIRKLKREETDDVVHGQLHMWLEIRPALESRDPKVPLEAPPKKDFEVRIICWRTKEVPLDMGDYYCKFWIGGSKKQSTDIHWRCQSGRASWNWRIKIPVTLPLDSPEDSRLTLQLWDQDVIKWNDVVGEAQIDLYKWFLRAYNVERSVEVFKEINQAVDRKNRQEMGLANDSDLEDELSDEEDEEEDDDDENEVEGGREVREGDEVENPLLLDPQEHQEVAEEEIDVEKGATKKEEKESPRRRRRKKKEEDDEVPTQAENDQKDAEFMVKQLKDMVGLGDLDETAQWIRLTYHNRKRRRIYYRGSVGVSIEIIPKEDAELRPAGYGISSPNQNPVLPPRTGRLSFSLNPLVMLSALCGPKLATAICATGCCALFLFVWFYIGMYYENAYTIYQAIEYM